MKHALSRRSFLGLIGLSPVSRTLFSPTDSAENAASFKTLFQGDSITDGNRGRSDDPNHILGHGYAFAIASLMGWAHPARNLSFVNKGNSGDTIPALIARWKPDAIDVKPDLISILVGVNDVLHCIRSGRESGPAFYERDLRTLMEMTRTAMRGTTVVLCEPFILPTGMVREDTTRWSSEIGMLQQACANVARSYNCIYIRFQEVFTNALKRAPAEYWIWDGIHPTFNGHGLMAKEWLKEVGKVVPELKPN
jgi:lysophospholipase L1-like esterase